MNFKVFIILLCAVILTLTIPLMSQTLTATVNSDKTAELSNGIVSMTINSKGQVNYFALNGKDLVNANNKGRFYFSYNSAEYHELSPTLATLTRQTDELVEITHTNNTGELIIEQAYILLRDTPGVYCYITLKGNTSTVNLREMRVVLRVDPDIFTYAYVSDQRHGPMVSPADLTGVEDIMDATYLLSDGSIYTKYDWANYVDEDIVHGLCNDGYGLWVISSSDEYLNGGPMKQELMVHGTDKTPLALKMLQGEHFGASSQNFGKDDEKIYGPFFIYANSGEGKDAIIEDAKNYAVTEQEKWPYTWMHHRLYPTERTIVTGKLNIRYGISPANMMVVLAEHGSPIYNQGKSYMFWNKADANGDFSIDNVRPGNYSLFVFATQGEMTDEIEFENIEISGASTHLGTLNLTPEKYEQLVWQIGEPDRTARGFKLADQPRSYGLWDSVPANLTYTIGISSPAEDWYYAQTKKGTWEILFNLDETYSSGFAYITLAVAGAASNPVVHFYMNDNGIGMFEGGNDGSVYRSANQGGRYQKKILRLNAGYLRKGENKLSLKLVDVGNRGGIIYDAIKMETGEMLTGNQQLALQPLSGIKVFPNPATEVLNLNLEKVLIGSNVILQDLYGNVFIEMTTACNIVQLNMENIPRGVYVLSINSSEGKTIRKIIKN